MVLKYVLIKYYSSSHVHNYVPPAAADAVDAVVAASRPKPKLLTSKQRLGKIMGIKGNGARWKP